MSSKRHLKGLGDIYLLLRVFPTILSDQKLKLLDQNDVKNNDNIDQISNATKFVTQINPTAIKLVPFLQADFVIGVLLEHSVPSLFTNTAICGKVQDIDQMFVQAYSLIFSFLRKYGGGKNNDTRDNNKKKNQSIFRTAKGLQSLDEPLKLGILITSNCGQAERSQKEIIKMIHMVSALNKTLIGIVGPLTSNMLLYIAPLSSYYKFVLMSPTANVYYTHHTQIYNYTYLLYPPQSIFISALTTLLTKFHWTVINVIHSTDPYFTLFYSKLIKILPSLNICVSRDVSVSSNETEVLMARQTYIDQLLPIILNQNKVRIVVLLLRRPQYLSIMTLLKNLNGVATTNLIFIAVDSWPGSTAINAFGLSHISLNTIIIRQFNRRLNQFWEELRQYLSTLTMNVNSIPYPFIPGINWEPTRWGLSYKSQLIHNFIRGQYDVSFNEYFIYQTAMIDDSFDILLLSFYNLVLDQCQQLPDIYEAKVKCAKNNILKMKMYVNEINFKGYVHHIKFLDRRIEEAHLTLSMFKITSGTYRTVDVSEFNSANKSFTRLADFQYVEYKENDTVVYYYNMPTQYNMRWYSNKSSNFLYRPSSSCSEPCEYLPYPTIKIPSTSVCCWTCKRCNAIKEILGTNVSVPCIPCGPKQIASKAQNMCVNLPKIAFPSTPIGPVIIKSMAYIGLIIFFLFLVVYMMWFDNIAFKSDMGLLLNLNLAGIGFGFMSAVFMTRSVFKANCDAALFCFILSFILIFTSYFFKAKWLTTKLSANMYQMRNDRKERITAYLHVFSFVSVQIIIELFCFLHNSALNPIYHENINMKNVLESQVLLFCKLYPVKWEYLLIILLYQGILLILCLAYIFKLRNVITYAAFRELYYYQACGQASVYIIAIGIISYASLWPFIKTIVFYSCYLCIIYLNLWHVIYFKCKYIFFSSV